VLRCEPILTDISTSCLLPHREEDTYAAETGSLRNPRRACSRPPQIGRTRRRGEDRELERGPSRASNRSFQMVTARRRSSRMPLARQRSSTRLRRCGNVSSLKLPRAFRIASLLGEFGSKAGEQGRHLAHWLDLRHGFLSLFHPGGALTLRDCSESTPAAAGRSLHRSATPGVAGPYSP